MAVILVIDDEPDIRDILNRKLTALGHTILQAGNGEDGLDTVKNNKVDLIITDIIMPEKGGVETMMEIHHSFPGIKIISMTGKVPVDSGAFKSLNAQFGVKHILRKPFSLDEMAEKVTSTLKE